MCYTCGVRQVIHLDLDAFFASVEVLLNPQLQGKPVIVAMGNPSGRGVVSTASYEARKFGVHSAMPLFRAAQLCPQAIIVPVRHRVYSEYSRRVMNILREYSLLLEQVSIDEAYLEIPAEQDAKTIAKEIQQRIKDEIGLDSTLAVAANKLVSKVACNTVKPRGFIVVAAGDEERFLAPLPVEKLPGAGRVTREKLKKWNVQTIGDLARVPAEELRAEFGKVGEYLQRAARGISDSAIETDRDTKSVSQENTFERDTRDARVIEKELRGMSERVARDLQRAGYRARTIVLKLRYGDFTTITRQTTLPAPTRDAQTIVSCTANLLEIHWDSRRAVRLIGVGAHGLVAENAMWQMELGIEN
ncbi:MAG: DNA polymerase IV [Chloroflexi bacterium]|nr:DNA polymerase IV [Chloroflexota bacterium]